MDVLACIWFGIVNVLDEHAGAITTVATIVIAAFTIVLARVSRRQADLTKESMIAGERAFVFAKDVRAYYEFDKTTNQYNWRFRPIWENSGDTPTKNMTMHTRCMLLDDPLPPGFNFDENTTITGKALIPPRSTIDGGISPTHPAQAISPQDIADVQSGEKILYLWGWARYSDVFPNTQQHITRFCWFLTPLGDPFAYVAGKIPPDTGGVSFPSLHHSEGNCADDECT